MNTLGWLFIFGGIYLFRAAARGQILDEQGKFVLLQNMGNTITALITSNDKALKEADKEGAFGILAPTPAPAVPLNDDNYRNPSSLPKVWATNPRSVDQAIAWLDNEVAHGLPIWPRRCLAMCARAYGLAGSGTFFAIDIWSQMPTDMRHTGKVNIPTGALLLYNTGSRAGHIAIYAGNGYVYSTDIKRFGHVDKVRFTDLLDGPWHLKWVGWTPPYFPKNSNSKRTG